MAALLHDKRLVGDREAKSVGDDRGAAEAGLRHHDNEFLAAQAADQIDAAYVAQRTLSQFAQHVVAGEVAVAVIDLLEMVDVEHHQRGRGGALGQPRHQLGQMGKDVAPVVEPGQLIGQR